MKKLHPYHSHAVWMVDDGYTHLGVKCGDNITSVILGLSLEDSMHACIRVEGSLTHACIVCLY
jgi:hypothetical protein